MEQLKAEVKCSQCRLLYTDARVLSCGHHFCYQCIVKLIQVEQGKDVAKCRNCNVETFYPHNLLPNPRLNAIVGFIIRYERLNWSVSDVERALENLQMAEEGLNNTSELEESRTNTEAREASNSSYHEQTSIGSDNIIGRDNEVEESLPDGHVDAGDHHSVDECSQDDCDENLGGEKDTTEDNSSSSSEDEGTGELKALIQQHKYPDTHCFVKCNNCMRRHFKGSRFKCGMCDDHDLCGECMDLHLSEVIHDNSHIFMRLKKPCNRRKSFQKPYLHESLLEMTESIDTTDQEDQSQRIKCDVCSGDCTCSLCYYRCGICEDFTICQDCDSRSQQAHDDAHVLLMFRRPFLGLPTGPLVLADFY